MLIWSGPPQQLTLFAELVRQSDPPVDLQPLTGGGPPRWRQKLVTKGQLGSPEGPYAIDIIGWPADNPWDSWMRFGGFDFFADGERAAICTWNGDVWIVSGIGLSLERLTWQRIATGLFQPLGLKIVDEQIYILGRDQITILHDLNGDGEADFYQNFNNDQQVTEHFHEFAMDLQTDAKGNFYYMKGGRHALDALIPQHGTLIRVAQDGSKSEILANGFRAPNGLLVTPDGQFISSDQQGHWVPANRINLIKAGGFYGYMWSYHQGERPTAFDEPLAWIHPSIDRSPSSFVWVNSDRWGPFQNRIISPSYGMGKLELVLREDVDGVVQGGLTRFPLDFETGIMRGRFHPGDGQLYLCGLFGWAGNKTRPGGFYRVRYTGKPAHMPSQLRVARDGVVIRFTNPLDPNSATDPGNYHVQVWNYRWTEKYGSPDFKLDGEEGRDQLPVETVALATDRRSVFLKLPGLVPVMQMHIDFNLRGADGTAIRTFVHHTIHTLGDRTGRDIMGNVWLSRTQRVAPSLGNESPGLIQEIRSVSSEAVEPDARSARLAALFVPQGKPPSPFLPAGQLRSRWRGFLKLDLNERIRFHAEGRGQVRLRINEREVPFSGGGEGLLDDSISEPVSLRRGLNRIEVDYSSPAGGDAIFRLNWSSAQRLLEPVPATVFVHDEEDPVLQEGRAVRRGRQLFAEHRCASCHLPKKPFGKGAMPELNSPGLSLDGIGSRLNRSWLQRWIQNPYLLKRDSRMPRLLHGSEMAPAARDITSFLATLRAPGVPAKGIARRLDDPQVVSGGENLFHSLGCAGCHSFTDDPDRELEALVSLTHLRAKWQPHALAAYLLKPEEHDPWSRMPNFRLSRTEAVSLATYLFSRSQRAAPSPAGGSTGSTARGQELVASLGCVNCHQLSGLSTTLLAPTLEELEGKAWASGCLAPSESFNGRSPHFSFGEQQRQDLNAFLKNHTASLKRRDWTEFAQRQREKLRCKACHELDTTKGRWSPLIALFGEEQAEAAGANEQETIHLRIPPITWAGEQFRPEWTERLIAGRLAAKSRPRLKARMPSFPAYAPGLARGLSREHGLAPTSPRRPPFDRRQARVGRSLIKKEALGCLDCHPVGSRPALAGPDTETINFNLISQRLRYPFYLRFLRDPQQILPGTMMPTFMEGGKSTLRSVYGGDATKQSEALWNFMRGLSQVSKR